MMQIMRAFLLVYNLINYHQPKNSVNYTSGASYYVKDIATYNKKRLMM